MASDRRIWTVVPAAGLSSRFAEKGYRAIKPSLLITDREGITRSMIEHVLHNLPNENVLVGLPPGYCMPQGCMTYTVNSTRGQADTILQLLHLLPGEDSVVISDCDIVINRKCVQHMIDMNINLAVVRTNDPAMSYIDELEHPCIFAEKDPISEWGIVGVKYFETIAPIRESLRKAMKVHTQVEPYFSHALNFMAGITAYEIQREDYQDWGTPEAVVASGASIYVT